jgi:phosphatidylglycerophosphate synthase
MTMAAGIHNEYRFEDRSLLLRWLQAPLFMPIVRALPRALTPNQITLAGHLCMWSGAAVILMARRATPMVLLALAFGYTGYNVADIIDGMHARHSGRTSKLGELLDHGLDAFDAALIPLTYGIALREPAWLILASTATIGYLQFVTFLHGYRVGYVILGEIGVIEGLALAALVCVAAALGGLAVLTRPVFSDVPGAGLLAIAFIASALPAFVSMRGLWRRGADLTPLAVLSGAILAWYGFGALGVRAAGLLILFTSACQMMRVTSARLRRMPLALWDGPFMAATIAAAVGSIAWGLDARVQTALAGGLILYAIVLSAVLFFRTAAAIRRR